eukprot:4434620-Amphidinium_carterae.1
MAHVHGFRRMRSFAKVKLPVKNADTCQANFERDFILEEPSLCFIIWWYMGCTLLATKSEGQDRDVANSEANIEMGLKTMWILLQVNYDVS